MSDKNIVSGKGRNRDKEDIIEYLNYIRNNNRPYFKFKSFSQIHTVGDNLMSKKDRFIRVLFENVNGLPVDSLGEKFDYKHLCHLFQHCSIDIFGAAETQMNFALASTKDSASERFFQEDPLTPYRISTSQNTSEFLGKRQYGGTLRLARGELTDRVIEAGSDCSGLGKWSWIKVKGRDGTCTRFISIYKPCTSRRNQGFTSAFKQWKRFFGGLDVPIKN